MEGRQRSFKRATTSRRTEASVRRHAIHHQRGKRSGDATGELVVLPLHPGMELDVREHAFVLGSHQINYSFVRVKGLTNILFGGPGLVLLHGYGNVFERKLKAGESIMVEPGAFLYKDSSVSMEVEFQKLGTGFFGGTNMSLARMTGPGRIGIQSMYVHHHTE
jgi:uncharacterized protein (AIM24 family)